MMSATTDQCSTARRDEPACLWLSISGYARVHNVTRVTVYKWLEAGLLEFYRVGAVTRVKNRPPVSV